MRLEQHLSPVSEGKNKKENKGYIGMMLNTREFVELDI